MKGITVSKGIENQSITMGTTGTTHAYLRVSTDRQDESGQREAITRYCASADIHVDSWVIDVASGATRYQARKLQEILDHAARGDTIIASEISRIARSTLGVLTFLQEAAQRGLFVIACESGIVLDNSIASKIQVTMLALCAEIERDLLRTRTKAALDARRAAGLPMGRPLGAKSKSKISSRRREIDELLRAKVSKRAIARVLQCSPTTLHTFLNSVASGDVDKQTLDLFQSKGNASETEES